MLNCKYQQYLPIELTVAPSNAGTIEVTPDGYIFKEGEQVTIEAIPNFDYMLFEWTGDVLGSPPVRTNPMPVDADDYKEITANFIYLPDYPDTIPINPSPGNDTYGWALDTTLSWSKSQTPLGDDMLYDLYFGEDSVPTTVTAEGMENPEYTPTALLEQATTYKWQVYARDSYQPTGTSGDVWTFTTTVPPDEPYNPSPADSEVNVLDSAELSWEDCTDPDGDNVTYDIFFGQDNPDNMTKRTLSDPTDPTFDPPGSLDEGSSFFWQVQANDDKGATIKGPVWSFYTGTPPSMPENPDLANGATNVPLNLEAFCWETSVDPDQDPITYSIKFGPNTLPSNYTATGLSDPCYYPSNLLPCTTYYWKITAETYNEPVHGPTWTFTTTCAPTTPSSPSPSNGAVDTPLTPTLTWSVCTDPDSDSVTYDIYFGIPPIPQTRANNDDLTSPTFTPPVALQARVEYEWYVVAKDDKGAESVSTTWSFTTE